MLLVTRLNPVGAAASPTTSTTGVTSAAARNAATQNTRPVNAVLPFLAPYPWTMNQLITLTGAKMLCAPPSPAFWVLMPVAALEVAPPLTDG